MKLRKVRKEMMNNSCRAVNEYNYNKKQVEMAAIMEKENSKCSVKGTMSNPSYYDGDVTPIDVIEACNWGEGFCKGNAIKYIIRAGRKTSDEVSDLKKAIDYLQRRIYEVECAQGK